MLFDLLIGGLAGSISRTVTAPLELYKLQRQNSFMPHSTIKSVIKREGIRYLWKGNYTNCLRVFPQNAINYGVFQFSKNNIVCDLQNEELRNFLSGCLGGSVSMFCIYPLETIRSRLCLQHANSHYKGLIDACRSIPFSHLYKGLRMSIMGYAPFTAISFSMYFNLRHNYEYCAPFNSDINKMLCGGVAGLAALTVTYPTDLIRRRLQLQNFDARVPKYDGILNCIKKINSTEGFRGFYRGLLASYIKIFPALSIQFLAMEKLTILLQE